MRYCRCLLIFALALLSACGDAVPRPIAPASNKAGVHLLLDDGREHWPDSLWPEHLRYAREAVGEWGFVTVLLATDNLEADKWQVFMDLCAEYHLTPIIRLATEFDRTGRHWERPPEDADGRYRTIAAEYANFLAGLEWPTDQHFVIVGNEPNHGNEWGGAPDPAAYARYLIDMADAIHAADPQARVLNAGFDPFAPDSGGQPMPDGFVYLDEVTFLDQMVAAEPDVFRFIDVWASHPYPTGPFTDPPWQQVTQIDAGGPDEPPLGTVRLGINSYEWELWKLSTFGITSLPVMITETGWRHTETADPEATDTSTNMPDAQTAADYLMQAFYGSDNPSLAHMWTPWNTDPRVIAVTPFAFNGEPAQWGHTNWLILDEDGNILGTYPVFDHMVP